ncbi:MAG: GNAT family N-acetyltransferase [Acidobacteriota bacterium]|nr:GNAT family N-acetyltransferase [Acidobacteriota bacterium]
MSEPEVCRLAPADRAAWQRLFEGYLEFYETSIAAAAYERAWEAFQQDEAMHARGARLAGELVGIAHFLRHPSTTAADVCYLQDLFTAPHVRGRGVARALIAAVVDDAREHGCSRVYWVTHETNSVARALYDKVALNSGFVRYQIAL